MHSWTKTLCRWSNHQGHLSSWWEISSNIRQATGQHGTNGNSIAAEIQAWQAILSTCIQYTMYGNTAACICININMNININMVMYMYKWSLRISKTNVVSKTSKKKQCRIQNIQKNKSWSTRLSFATRNPSKKNSTSKAQFVRNRNHVVRFQQRNMMLKTLRIENHLIESVAQQSRLLDHCKPAVVLDGDLMMQKPKICFMVF